MGKDSNIKAGLTIDLDALAENYHIARRMSYGAETACVVKANAYGLGVEKVAPALFAAGAGSFFVATPEEGAELRELLPTADIYIFNGFEDDRTGLYKEYRLRPCLKSLDEMRIWQRLKERDSVLSPALHVDTGINRLGLDASDCQKIDVDMLSTLDPVLLLSHLACADCPEHEMNRIQYERFRSYHRRFGLPGSLINSAGLFLDAAFRFQMTRPGIALYGGDPLEEVRADFPFRPVIYLYGRIAQMRVIEEGESVGYGASFYARRRMRIGIVTIGYADGYLRSARRGFVSVNGYLAPLIGRVSMDMLMIDLTDYPGATDSIRRGELVELIGEHISLGRFARFAGTIPHQVITVLGNRVPRYYISGDKNHLGEILL